ncbi:hypothetical protein SAMD00019534_025030 [Acytostelium subglobosum LB1]|uniref:hypothetical protein n=1 Tax=Acytostelium subglobosum LB1 TaxID=1410327 RepID=UPI000644B828|nr:hypothetical protein SAMD00019534_025030 [Acytostelium subglobosum LB1]GAM19328.1 hypothetical protein SAMD00019534_025030 [Acytostelium subglobosum LB1]|eukprot:XP_012757255.1 hypothetical protein SAMD00019534_025030 [Acytostelium subglobosum LB1]
MGVIIGLGKFLGEALIGYAIGKALDLSYDKVLQEFSPDAKGALFRNEDNSYRVHDHFRICLVTTASSWLRRVGVKIYVPDDQFPEYVLDEVTVGDREGFKYDHAFGNVKWDFIDLKVKNGSVIKVTLYRDTLSNGFVDCGTLEVDSQYSGKFAGQCLMVYWDDDNGTLFTNKNMAYTSTILIKNLMGVETLPADNTRSLSAAVQRKKTPKAKLLEPKTPKDVAKDRFGDGTLEKNIPANRFHPVDKSPFVDKDGDGKPDKTATGKPAAKPKDTDKDGIPDSKDKDKDGDGKIDKPATAKPKASARA